MGEISVAVIILIVIPYFLPSIIALFRSKSNTTAIVMLNLFLGWTFIGWVVALIWAVTKDREMQTIVVNNNAYSDNKTINPLMSQPIADNLQNDVNQKTLSSQEVKSEEKNPKNHQEKIENLQKLKQLLDDGILTQDEFEQQKKQILG
ncbi:superinfection immunity protein [Flavobacterium psychrophilum]|uniref:superinfection immunity protein n=1 Tax=Flavobacterium psychrophilum TaxID=96345 RepID=UPI00313A3F3D